MALAQALPAQAQAPSGGAAAAPAPPPSDADMGAEDDIVVNANRPLPGSVVGDIKPELTYTPADIRAYGVSSVTDLLNELGPQVRSDQGRGGEAPAVLLNGKRISSFSEIRDIPTEAIIRVEILPEEVALKYGYSSDQKVVNIVLRRRFRAVTGEAQGLTTTDGGANNGVADLDMLRIHGDGRFNLDLKFQDTQKLTEADRGLQSVSAGRPYDLTGNITGITRGGAIDPALSAAAGQAVTVAGVPASAATAAPTLADFVATANDPNTSGIGPYRTLAPAKREFTLNSVYARPLVGKFSATLNGTFDITDTDALQGLPGTALTIPAGTPYSPFTDDVALYRYLGTTPLRQATRSVTGHLGGTIDGDVKKWRLSLTGNYDYAYGRTLTDSSYDVSAIQSAIASGVLNPFGPLNPGALNRMRATSTSNTGNAQFVGNGPLFDLPAGALSTTVKLGITAAGFDSHSLRFGTEQSASLSRTQSSGQVSVDVPIAKRGRFLGAIGNLSVNGNVTANRVSDFGTLTTWGYGTNWSPRDGLTLIASQTHDQGAPTMQQLGNPVIVTPGARVFDYRTGQTVDVTQTGGGNPNLLHDDRRVNKIALTWKPIKNTDLTVTANYIDSRIRNAIAGFPSPTAAIEAAFPDRFTRDADGNLTAIDTRPINFASEDRKELRWGINFSKRLKTSQAVVDAFRALRQQGGFGRPPGGAGGGPGGPGGAGGGGGFRGGGGGGRAGNSGGRLQIALYHTWYFRDDILIRPGGPKLDLLDGGTTGSGGGQPRHEIEAQIGATNNGIGVRFTGSWSSATTVDGGTGSATGDLHFSSLATANLRIFADLGQNPSLMKHQWARGMRVTLALNNITNSRQHVRDANGDTPISYQPAYLDPLGRTIRISIRKLFF
jgi:iron complex outermembrane recepter protein